MTDTADGTGHFKCPCATCIINEAQKYEEKKQYEEADLVMRNGLEYYSKMHKQVNIELNQFRARTKYNNSNLSVRTDMAGSNNETLKVASVMHYQHFSHRPTVRTREFTCPVAIFDQIPDPTQKPMYPKDVVYFDGNDNQLEEIRAAKYWAKNQSESLHLDKKISDHLRKLMSSEQFSSFSKRQEIGVIQSIKNPTDITNIPKQAEHVASEKLTSVCDPAEVENIDPSTPKTEIVANEIRMVTFQPKNHSLKNVPARNYTPSCSNCSTCTIPQHNNSNLVKTPLGTNMYELLEICVSNETTNCNSSGDVRLKSGISPIIVSSDSKIESILERSASEISTKKILENPTKEIQTDACARSKIPTLKKPTSNSEEFQEGVSPQDVKSSAKEPQTGAEQKLTSKAEQFQSEISCHKAVITKPICSKTFIVKPNPSETFVIPPAPLIDKETLTLVDDEDDDFLPYIPNKRGSQLFNPSDTNTSTTEAFDVILPSSTPNKRMSQFFRPPQSDVNTSGNTHTAVIPTLIANLSTITEMSKEHSSLSRPSQKTPLETIDKVKKSHDNSKDNSFNIISDPFDENLIENLLQKVHFPRPEHMNGFNKVNCDMGPMKLSAVVKLGNNKYNIIGEIGKGSYARILKLQDVKEKSKSYALKLQKPACPWEFYISKEIQRRLSSDLERSYFIQYYDIFLYRNGSVMMSDWAPYGSILNFVNILKASPYHGKRCPVAVAIWLSIQFVEAIQYLHSCNIIHGDVKPDNFVLCDEIVTDHACVKLIDYGRSIDMTLLPKNAVFTKVVTTEDYTCNEMRDNRPWTFQSDFFGLASTIYLLLAGEYMKTKKELNEKWILTKNLPRYVNRDMWNPIFENLLNVPSCKELPDLLSIRRTLEVDFNSLDRQTTAQQFTNIRKLLKK